MQSIFQALTNAYTYALDPQRFEDPANRPSVRASLMQLSNASSQLEKHGNLVDPSLRYLERSLAIDAREALSRYESGEYAGSRFLVTQLTQNCMTCHARVTGNEPFDLGERFLAETKVKELPPIERVSVEIAARQFEAAKNTYEEILRDPAHQPMVLNLGGTFEGYLRVCLGTDDDVARPRKAFEAYGRRADLSEAMKTLVAGWIASLDRIDLAAARGNELPTAKKLIADARLQKRFVSDRANLVDLVAAEILLHRYLQGRPTENEAIAEAYYLLAVADANLSRSYWIAETPFLLEQSIRTAPKSLHSREAYAFLEAYTLSGYAGMTLPVHVVKNLEELRSMVEK
jgi:hypothetical protein